MTELTTEGRSQLESLLAELESAIHEDRPARWLVDGTNGIDQSSMLPAERRADAVRLRDEIKARLTAASQPGYVEAKFARLAAQWDAETATESSFTKQILHPAYQSILGLGPAGVTPILRSLEQTPNYWFHALRHIAEVDPVKPEDRGNLRAMTDAWLAWGRREGYL